MLCDLCGAAISDGSEYHAVVRDSSVDHRTDPNLDGKRLLTARSPEHGRQLIGQYKARPFVARSCGRARSAGALLQHPEGLSEEALAEETGLTPARIGHQGTRHSRSAPSDSRAASLLNFYSTAGQSVASGAPRFKSAEAAKASAKTGVVGTYPQDCPESPASTAAA